MSDVYFVRTRHVYDSYVDLFKLAEVSGYPIIYVDEIPKSGVKDRTYILSPLNGEWKDGIQTDGRLIFWQLEYGFDKPEVPGVSEVWVSDSWLANKLSAKHVSMGSHFALNARPADAKPRRYDVAWMAYTPPRRGTVYDMLKENGLTIAPNGWGEERHEALTQSACMVTAHQLEDFHCIPPLRIALAAAYRLPYITETPFALTPFTHEHVITADYGELADKAVYWTRRMPAHDLSVYGASLYQYLCVENTFRKRIEAAL